MLFVSSVTSSLIFRSEIICPSFKVISKSPYLSASVVSWVTIITSLLTDISFNIPIIMSRFFLSRLPVGSSAMITSGFLMIALAIATLWRSPPESWFILRCSLPFKPTFSITSNISFSFLWTLMFFNRKLKAILSKTLRFLITLNSWKIKPM